MQKLLDVKQWLLPLGVFTVVNLVEWILATSEANPALTVIMPFIFSVNIGVIAVCAVIVILLALKFSPTPFESLIPNVVYLTASAIVALVIAKTLSEATVASGIWWQVFWSTMNIGASSFCFFILRAMLGPDNGLIMSSRIFHSEIGLSKETFWSFSAVSSMTLINFWNNPFQVLLVTANLTLLFLIWKLRAPREQVT